jgi:hypothetical protein
MSIRATAILVSIFFVGMLVFGIALSRGWFILGGTDGCTADDRRTVSILERNKFLGAYPAGVERKRVFSGCEGDDEYVYAGASYIFSSDRTDIFPFYRVMA